MSTGFAVHIASPGLDKSNGLKVAMEQRGVDPSRVIACGDAPNDIPMFDVVGLSVAVNDEFPEVSMSADLITESRGKDGSVELLKGSSKFILDWCRRQDSNLRSAMQRILSPPL